MIEPARSTVQPCDAIALLKLEGDELRPVAVTGLKREALARRFRIREHPRLDTSCKTRASRALPPTACCRTRTTAW